MENNHSQAGMTAKYFATSFAILNALLTLLVSKKLFPTSTISSSFVGLLSRSIMFSFFADCVPLFMAGRLQLVAVQASLVPSPVITTVPLFFGIAESKPDCVLRSLPDKNIIARKLLLHYGDL